MDNENETLPTELPTSQLDKPFTVKHSSSEKYSVKIFMTVQGS